MKQGIIDRMMNRLMKTVIKMQRIVIKTELIINKFILPASVVIFILMLIFSYLRIEIVSMIFVITFCVLIMLKLSTGWHSSIRKFSLFIFFYLIYTILLIGLVMMQMMSISSLERLFPYLVTVYFVLWVFLSLVAKPDVAKLANEILSAIITIVFTVGTYVMGIVLPKHLPAEVIDSIYKSEEALEQAIIQDNEVVDIIFQSSIYWAMERVFLYLLPFICITIISMTAINVKEYWLKKHPELKEMWDLNVSSENVTANYEA